MKKNPVGTAAVVLGVLAAVLTLVGPTPWFDDLPVGLRAVINGLSVAFGVWLWGGILAAAIRWDQRRRR